jgi:hypothetical protein
MDAAALAACVLFLGVAFNVTMVGQYVSWASLAVNALSGDRLPKLAPSQAFEAAKLYVAAVTWIMIMCSAALFFPLWQSFHWTAAIMVLTCALTGIMVSWGFKSPVFKKAVTACVALLIVFSALQFVPSVSRYGKAVGSNAAARINRGAESLEQNTEAVAAGKPETESDPATDDGAAPPNRTTAARETTRQTVANGDALNADAAPPTRTGGTIAAGEASGQETASTAAPKRPRTPGKLAEQIDDLYPDL